MKRKKIIVFSAILILLICICGGIYYYFRVQDKNSTLTVAEKQWIEENKNSVIDLSIVTDVPIFSYEGKGLLFDFLTSIEKTTGLEFNELSYSLKNKPTSEYSFLFTTKPEENDILIYEDNYAVLTKEKVKYNHLEDINVMTLGVLEQDLERVNEYLKANGGISFKTYKDVSSMLAELNSGKINGLVLPKLVYIDEIIANENLNIAYNITEMTEKLVLRLGNNKKLNVILKKYYSKWKKDNFTSVFNEHFSENYFAFKEIYENAKVQFRGKRYTYGFVANAPYDSLKNGSLIGINSEIIKDFSKMADIEISFVEYKNLSELVNAFNENKIDFFLNTSSNANYAMDTYATVDAYDGSVVVVSHLDNNVTIHSISSLISKTVSTLEDSKISASLAGYDIHVKTFGNITDLLQNIHRDTILVLDERVYNTYLHTTLKDYKVDYRYHLDKGYHYISRDIHENEVFNEFFDFYLSFMNENAYHNRVSYKNFDAIEKDNHFNIIASIFLLLLGIFAVFILLSKKKMRHKKKKGVTKEEKLKYIDQLTSLKNRNFLNDSIHKWDDSEIYPQTIVIIDLNNIAYINDNYGHEEGDKVIIEAANILIKNQLENSEILRTDGNEFLIYLVAYDEKQIVAYLRKLTKELKDLSHGFGAALGYSMINDGIKTIDDAINEATLDMRNNKEEAQG